MLRLRPLVHVEDMSASVAFYEQLGARVVSGSRDGDWTLLEIGGTEFGLLAHPPNPEQQEGAVELCFETDELDSVSAHLGLASTDEGFGRQVRLTAPDGLLIKINELDPDRIR